MTTTETTGNRAQALFQIAENNSVILAVMERLAQGTPEPEELESMKAQLKSARRRLDRISNSF